MILAFQAESWKSGPVGVLLGVLTIIAGVLMVAHPLFGLGFLTLVLAVYFLSDGIFEIILAFQVKPESGWGWTLVNGIVSVLFAIFIWRQWPLSGGWAVGLLVGVHILFSGWVMIAGGSAGRRLAKTM